MIKVMIERRIVAGREAEAQQRMRALRREAIHAPGYISGETLQDRADPGHCVILSSWQSARDWDAWARSDVRRRSVDEIRDLLADDERIVVLEPT